jgi:8-oxo-dGTP pyrophosphatase MutT (NUDIX family)
MAPSQKYLMTVIINKLMKKTHEPMAESHTSNIPMETGSWGEKVSWELYASSELPPVELCTAVFCVAFTDEDRIVLTRVARGWEILGGHIEDGEAVTDTLVRESQEEGGFTPTDYQLLGYKKLTSSEPIPHQNPTKMYPFPTGYVVYYRAITDQPLASPSGEEVLESGSFTFEEAAQLVDGSTLSIIDLAIKENKLNS